MMRSTRWVLGVILWVLAVTASAHSALLRAEPGSRAVLTESPRLIRLWFNEPVEAAFSTVTLETAKGKKLSGLTKPKIAPDDAKQLIVELPALDPGTYKVRYRVLSVDGHIVDWGYSFRLEPAPAKP